MLKHNLLIESGSIGTDMLGNRLVCRLADKDASRLPEIVRLTITLFECPCLLDDKYLYVDNDELKYAKATPLLHAATKDIVVSGIFMALATLTPWLCEGLFRDVYLMKAGALMLAQICALLRLFNVDRERVERGS